MAPPLARASRNRQNLRLAFYATPYTNGGLLLGWLDLSSGAPAGNLTLDSSGGGGRLVHQRLHQRRHRAKLGLDQSVDKGHQPRFPFQWADNLDISGGFLAAPLDFTVGDQHHQHLSTRAALAPH